jgi:putative lipoic acid-binding regulatory protein
MKRLIVVPLLIGLTLVVLIGGSVNERLASDGSVAAAEESERLLSVFGVGSATAPANALSLQFVIEHWDDYYGPGGPMTMDEKLEPVIEAIIAAGIDEAAISVPSSVGAHNLIRITVALDTPSQEQVQALFEELAQAPRMRDMYLVHVVRTTNTTIAIVSNPRRTVPRWKMPVIER